MSWILLRYLLHSIPVPQKNPHMEEAEKGTYFDRVDLGRI